MDLKEMVCEGINWLRNSPVAGSCKDVYELLREFLEQLGDSQLPKKDAAPWNYLIYED
jgi:hypothetical protein